METRQARSELTVYTRRLEKRTIPPNAILHDFRTGSGHEGLAPLNPNVVSFHYDGQVYFNIALEVAGKTVMMGSANAANVRWS
jgi:hypothetical protein